MDDWAHPLLMLSLMRGTFVMLGLGLTLLLVAGCEADPYGDLPKNTSDNVASKASASCSQAIEGKDPTSLPVCTGTKGVKGRCVERANLGSFKDTFETADCKGDSFGCVPDEVIKAGSKIELKTCKAVLGAEGRCFWPLAKDIVSNYDILKGATKDQCDDSMVCAPCVNPLTKAKTGVCETGSGGDCKASSASTDTQGAAGKCPQVEPILDTKDMPTLDCGSNMVCVAESLVGAQASHLKKCAQGVCAPKKAVERGGNYVPKTCRSTASAEGRCTNIGVPQIAEQKDLLPQAECDADERCAPCFDPRDGTDTGACKTASCDAPKEPAKKFASCCGGRARCVPTAAVDAGSRDMLSKDSCSGDTPLCAPVELIPLPDATPKQCKTLLGFISGICVSKCAIDNPLGSFIQGDCPDGDMCAPCNQLPKGTKGC